jgi:hypothetical protein
MASREKDSSDFDLETFIDLFDTALSSDNPAVKRALKNLLMIATLVDSDLTPEQRVKGPLRRLVEDLRDVNRRIDRLQEEQAQRQYTRTVTTPYSPPYTVGTGIGTSWPPGTIIGTGTASGGYTLTSTTAVDDQYLPDQQFMNDLLDQKYQEVLKRLEEK